jgi:nucleoside-diphosphate-sugar epimerase
VGSLTVAVTGPTGDVGRAAVRALERSERVGRIVGMARRPFDPAEHGWERTEYRQGDILDRASVQDLVAGADVVVHLAFIIFGDHDEAHRVNLEGSRNVFEATAASAAQRLVYTSSVAAYGFHADAPDVLTEDDPARGSEGFYYSRHKAELEGLLAQSLAGSEVDAYVLRPCIVAGRDAPTLVRVLTGQGISGPVDPARRLLEALPVVRPVLPDPGVPLQLVHHDDVARAIVAAAEGRGTAGVYNLAAPDPIAIRDVARAMGWASIPVPRIAIEVLAELLERAPLMPSMTEWITSLRKPVLMDSDKAERELGIADWRSSIETLHETIAAARRGA